jgi:ATP-binding cassette subfamily C exporter for protease/lipase/ATP-binding cassette subfamily C protein EexD
MTSVPAVASSANEPAFAGRSPHSGGEIRNALRSLRPHFAMAGIFSSCINLLYLSSPLYLMQVYNRVLVNENITTLILLTLVLAVALLAMALLDTIRAQILIRCGIRLDQMLAARVFQSLIVKSAKQGFSGGAQRLRELDNFRTFITGPGIYFAFDLPWIPLYLLILFFIHPILGVVATLGAAVLLGLAFINEFSTRGPLKKAEASASQSFVFTENIVRHADVVMAMGMRNAVERHWQTSRIGMLNEQAFASDKNAAISSTIRFARLLLQSVMLGTGAWLAIDHSIMPATIFAASIIMGRALVPVEQGVATWKQFIAAREGYNRVRELLADHPDSAPRTIVPAAHNAVGANEIEFSIAARREPILKNLSFELNGGQAIGIVGPSGSGKSTLARLLIGAAAPSKGTLRFGGLEYAQWDQSEFGRLVGYLPQDVGLFAGTVRENIARFGNASIDEIIAAAKLAGIHDMILDLPQQYDTMLGSGGVGLSGGQRQRLGLARALLGAPSLLVLDEPNANLDTAGEEALKRALLAFKERGATIIVITHRTTVLEVVDALMVLRRGQLEMIGPPDAVYDHLKQTSGRTSVGQEARP